MSVPVSAPEYDTVPRRSAAFVIDYFIAGLIATMPSALVTIVSGPMGPKSLIIAILGDAACLLFPVYYVFCHVRYGGTPGKRLVGLSVQTLDGQRPTTSALMKRHAWLVLFSISIFVGMSGRRWLGSDLWNVLYPISSLAVLGWVILEIVEANKDPRRRMIHDRSSGTVVRFREFKNP